MSRRNSAQLPLSKASAPSAVAAQRQALIEERLQLATDAVAEARGLLARASGASPDTKDEAILEKSLAHMVSSIGASLDLACDCVVKMQKARGSVTSPPEG